MRPPERPDPRQPSPQPSQLVSTRSRGLLLCGTCGRKMTGTVRNKARQAHVRYYHCRRDAGGCLKGGGAWVKADSIEAWVIGLAIGVAQSSDALDMIQAESGVLADELRGLAAERDDDTGQSWTALRTSGPTTPSAPTAYDRNRKAFQNAAEEPLRTGSPPLRPARLSDRLRAACMTDWSKLTADEQRKHHCVSLVADITVMSRTKNGGNASSTPSGSGSAGDHRLWLSPRAWRTFPTISICRPEWQQFVAQGIAVANVAKLAVTL